MAIPYSDLSTKYRELADQFITDINATSVIFIFRNNALASTSFQEAPQGADMFGGRVPIKELMGHSDQGGVNLRESVTSGTIQARIYWREENRTKELEKFNITDNKNICKMICTSGYLENIRNCSYAIINGYNCKLIKDPVPYGLFGSKCYLSSYWEISSE